MRRLITNLILFLFTASIGVLVFNSPPEGELIAVRTPPAVAAPTPSQHHDFFSLPKISPSPSPSPQPPADEAPREISCDHDRILGPVWKILMKGASFRESVIGSDASYCEDVLDVALIDVNGDAQPEIFLWAKTFAFCGAVGNCDIWIFQKRGSKYRMLLHGDDYIDRAVMGEQLLRTKTRGYYDLLLKGHFSAAHTSFSYYKFDGRRYVEERCLYEVPKYDTRNELDSEMITCKEFESR